MQKKRILRIVLLLAVILVLAYISTHMPQTEGQSPVQTDDVPALTLLTDAPRTPAPDAALQTPDPGQAQQPIGSEPDAPEDTVIVEGGSYTEVDDVAYYLHTYGHLPDNYITKAEAEDAGWKSYAGNLWDVAYGMSIGGDRFSNYEGQLPKGERYYEADVNYDGGYRGGERIVYTEDGDIWYTSDHYENFERLY